MLSRKKDIIMKSFEFYKLKENGNEYKISGNMHTLTQLYKRDINGDIVKRMVKLSISKMEIQKTYAVIHGNDKLLMLRINETKFFIITCLIDKQRVKSGTVKIYV